MKDDLYLETNLESDLLPFPTRKSGGEETLGCAGYVFHFVSGAYADSEMKRSLRLAEMGNLPPAGTIFVSFGDEASERHWNFLLRQASQDLPVGHELNFRHFQICRRPLADSIAAIQQYLSTRKEGVPT